MLKVLVLCIDGLEAKLIERWNIKEYKQKYYGIIKISESIKKGDPIYTPLIWASFLLGEPAYKYNFTIEKIRYERLKIGYGWLFPLYSIRLKLFDHKKLGLRSLLKKLRLFNLDKVIKHSYKIESLPQNVKIKTIVEVIKNRGFQVWIKDFPSYNDSYYAKIRTILRDYFNINFNKRKKIVDEIYKFASKRLEEAINSLKNYHIIFYYTNLIDVANHMFYRPKKLKAMITLAEYYMKFANKIKELLNNLTNYVLLIISDHGYDPISHDHSVYGFWSLNIKPPFTPIKITDFYNLILDLLYLI